ncbi:hypothetical protein D8674_005528 [Pyrus ussuriensis x Pyrus communis]|uniref:Uncharacterized protein n=1 Tax=Pyrus ussuriensis x Pyrus communis TaxID=2448454 RepID=A0A5N5FW40_9ROSA|nr:hypothetical protein D8674_005528 [Pyrus ussuriensis x Pyrus communis]
MKAAPLAQLNFTSTLDLSFPTILATATVEPWMLLTIEDKKRQYAAAKNYLEDVLHSALATSE